MQVAGKFFLLTEDDGKILDHVILPRSRIVLLDYLIKYRVNLQQKIKILGIDLAAKRMASTDLLASNSTTLEFQEEGHTQCKEMAKKHTLIMS